MTSRNNPLHGWPHEASPFHAGERAMQDRSGLGERIAEIGRHVIRGAMPEDHRELFEKLPFVLVGTLDRQERPWATILTGAPGFLYTPDAQTLDIAALPSADDPAAVGIRAGATVGLLGIELSTRRRNRANGQVAEVDEGGFSLQIQQSFGNCPKYIQARSVHAVSRQAGDVVPFGAALPAEATGLVRRADTFFIATASKDAGSSDAAPSGGVDISHRGGKPGFVHVERRKDHSVLTTPDFLGNFLFNTLGNLAVNPRAGLLFLDFESGDLLQMTGRAEVIWEGPQLAMFNGAERLLRFHLDEGIWRPGALPMRASPAELSRYLVETGS